MKLLEWDKDGGPKSPVDGFYILEIKPLFSIVLLRFGTEMREAFHTHAFNALSWILKGKFIEHNLDGSSKEYPPSLKPKRTKRSTFHRVECPEKTWVLTLRGPWTKFWKEYHTDTEQFVTLTHGRKIIG